MPNPHRGEIEACLDGKSFRLCLTLSALAELEHAFNNDDMLALAERFQNGRLSARDAQRIIAPVRWARSAARAPPSPPRCAGLHTTCSNPRAAFISRAAMPTSATRAAPSISTIPRSAAPARC